MSEYQSLTIATADHIAVLELSRPDLLNRFDTILHDEFGPALQELADDGDVRVVISRSSTRAVVRSGQRASEGLDVGFYLEAMSLATQDTREGIASFKERRPGNWITN